MTHHLMPMMTTSACDQYMYTHHHTAPWAEAESTKGRRFGHKLYHSQIIMAVLVNQQPVRMTTAETQDAQVCPIDVLACHETPPSSYDGTFLQYNCKEDLQWSSDAAAA